MTFEEKVALQRTDAHLEAMLRHVLNALDQPEDINGNIKVNKAMLAEMAGTLHAAIQTGEMALP